MSSTPDSFRLPNHGALYTESIFDRCRDLITYNVWDGIPPHRLDSWIENFGTERERYLAAKILDALIYRSKDQTIALSKQLFQRVVPDLQRRRQIAPVLGDAYTRLKGNADPGVRIVPVTLPGRPVQSGYSVGRYLRRDLLFSDEWLVDCSDVPSLVASGYVVIFFDDFLGTGTQFVDFVCETGLRPALGTRRCVYAPLVAHKAGIEKLNITYAGELSVAAVETLDESHSLFHEEAGSFPDGENSTGAARDFYYWLLKDRGIDVSGESRRGFGCFELTYAFEHAIPDNSLPVLWWTESPNWQPLFIR